MGKTKIKTIDDAVAEVKTSKSAKKLETRTFGKKDELVEKLKAELGVDQQVSAADQSVSKSEYQPEAEKPEKTAEAPKKAEAKAKKPGKAKPRSKKYQEISQDLDKTKAYPVEEAVELVKKNSYSKFNGTLEAHINTAQTGIRGLVSLPYASGKKMTILAFGKGAENSGADIVGDDSTIDEISKGKISVDLVITTPEWMPKLAKVAKNLGPKGLMPNPKAGTITDDLKKAVDSFQEGKTEYKTESKAPVIHLSLGKLDQPSEELSQNVKILLSTLGKSRIKKVTLSPTMGPSVRVDLASV